MSENPMRDYVANFRANLPSGVTFESLTARYFFNGKRFISEWDAERYREYIIKFGYSAGEVTDPAPAITSEPVPQSDPIIGQAMTVDPATATGSPDPTISYQYTRAGTDIAGADALTYTPVSADYGELLAIDTLATNGITPDATTTTSVGKVAATFEEKFLYDDDANLPSLLIAYGDWASEGFNADPEVVLNANSPTGRAARVIVDGNNESYDYRTDIDAILGSAASPNTKTDYVEHLYIIEVSDTQNRTWYRPGGQAGFTIRLGSWFHQVSTDDPAASDGFPLGSFTGQTMVVRHRMEMPDQTKIKVWDINDPEPTDWQNTRTNPAAFTAFDTRIGTSFLGGPPFNEIWYFSVGANTAPPEDPIFGLIAPTGVDTMTYEASTDNGATSTLTINNDVTYTFEENV